LAGGWSAKWPVARSALLTAISSDAPIAVSAVRM
jgi:hypothetical protein